MCLEGVFLMCLAKTKPKKKPRHIIKVLTTLMLFHDDPLVAVGVNQSLICINKFSSVEAFSRGSKTVAK
jgi:hypothetical protein